MAMKYENLPVTTVKETSENHYICPELKLLQSIVIRSSLGQTIIRLVDNFLWTVEKCAEWSLPGQEIIFGDENGKASGKSELVRPLPWILFLPSLMMLRMIRMTVNVGAFMTGYSQVTPNKLVKFLQTCRTRLNDLKNGRMKDKRDKDEKSSMSEARRALIKSIRLTLSSLSCLDTSKPTLSPPPTKIHVSVLDPDTATTTSEEKSVTESTEATEKQRNLRNYSASEEDKKKNEEKETLLEKIDRLAMGSSEGDEDFDPANCSVSSNDSSDKDNENNYDEVDEKMRSSTDEDGSVSSDEHDNMSSNEDDKVSSSELCDIIEDANTLIGHNLTAVANEIEKLQAAERAIAQVLDQRSPIEESHDKVEERLSQRIDSPTCYTPDRSSQEGDSIFYSPISSDSDTSKAIVEKCVSRDSLKTNEFVNGEIYFISQSAPMISETSKTSGEAANNGAVVEKRSTNVSKCHKGKGRTSHGNRKKK